MFKDALRRLRSLRPKTTVKIAGRRYALPGRLLDINLAHEPWMDRVFAAALKAKPGAFVDVGVNAGQTLAKLLNIDPTRRYIGFEPQPRCAFEVDEFCRVNGLKNCSIIPVGLSDTTCLVELNFHSAGQGDSTASIARAHRPESFYTRAIPVPVFRGDEILAGPVSIIKIDVEGAELEVLRGLKKTLAAHRPFISFEVLNNYLRVTRELLPPKMAAYRNKRAAEISALLSKAGYRIFNIRGETLAPVDVITPSESTDVTICDYFAVPNELELSIIG